MLAFDDLRPDFSEINFLEDDQEFTLNSGSVFYSNRDAVCFPDIYFVKNPELYQPAQRTEVAFVERFDDEHSILQR